MKEDRRHKVEASRVIQSQGNGGGLTLEDNRAESLIQAKIIHGINSSIGQKSPVQLFQGDFMTVHTLFEQTLNAKGREITAQIITPFRVKRDVVENEIRERFFNDYWLVQGGGIATDPADNITIPQIISDLITALAGECQEAEDDGEEIFKQQHMIGADTTKLYRCTNDATEADNGNVIGTGDIGLFYSSSLGYAQQYKSPGNHLYEITFNAPVRQIILENFKIHFHNFGNQSKKDLFIRGYTLFNGLGTEFAYIKHEKGAINYTFMNIPADLTNLNAHKTGSREIT